MKRKAITRLQIQIKELRKQVDEQKRLVDKRLEKKQTFMRYMFYEGNIR